MLEVTVTRTVTSPEYRVFETRVQLYGFDRLTPRAARAALEIAFGNSTSGEVWSEGYGYRIYENSARKLRADQF